MPRIPHFENLDDLAYFALVAEHGGYAAAGRAHDIPKSRLSRRVARLEAQLGARLIQRSTRRFALTAVGEQVLHHARAMLAEAEAAQARVDEQTGNLRGQVQLACPPALLQAVVGPMLERFLLTWPQVRLHILASNRNIDVWHDGVDLALRVRDRGAILGPDEIVRPLALSPHLLVAAPAVLKQALPARPDDLAQLPTLALARTAGPQRLTLHGPNKAEVQVRHVPRLAVNDMMTLRDAALAGLGVAVLPRLLVHDALQAGTLQQVLPDWTPPPGVVQAVYASREGLRPVVRQLLDALVRGFASLIAQGRCLAAPNTV